VLQQQGGYGSCSTLSQQPLWTLAGPQLQQQGNRRGAPLCSMPYSCQRHQEAKKHHGHHTRMRYHSRHSWHTPKRQGSTY
jgi:hypothetical protein